MKGFRSDERGSASSLHGCSLFSFTSLPSIQQTNIMNMKLLLIAAIVASASATSLRQRNINARLNAERSVANKALSALHNAVRSGRATGGHTRGWDRNGNSGTHFVRSNGFGSLGSSSRRRRERPKPVEPRFFLGARWRQPPATTSLPCATPRPMANSAATEP